MGFSRLSAQSTHCYDLTGEEDAEELRCETGMTAAGFCLGGTAGWIYTFKLYHRGKSSVHSFKQPSTPLFRRTRQITHTMD